MFAQFKRLILCRLHKISLLFIYYSFVKGSRAFVASLTPIKVSQNENFFEWVMLNSGDTSIAFTLSELITLFIEEND